MTAHPCMRLLLAPVLACASHVAAAMEFEDATTAAGVEHAGESYGASWGDLDGDGFPDLFVSNHRSMPSLFLNRGNGTFLDVASQTLRWTIQQRADTHGASWFDYNNDGTQDLFVGVGLGNSDQFLVNERGALIDRTEVVGLGAGISDNWASRLPVWMDYNDDGRPDFVMTTMIVRQDGEDSVPVAQVMRQTASGRFVSDTENVGLSCSRQHYAQLIDINGDGRLEFVCPDGATYPAKVYDTTTDTWQELPFPVEVVGGPDTIVADFDNDGNMDIFHLGGTQLRPSGAIASGPNSIEAAITGGEKEFTFVSGGPVTFDLDWNVLGGGAGLERIRIGSADFSPDDIPFVLDPNNANVAGMPPETEEAPIVRIGYVGDRWTVAVRNQGTDPEGEFSNVYFQITGDASVIDIENTRLAFNDDPALPTLLINDGGTYTDTTSTAGFNEELHCVSVTAGDFDNDMYVDLYLACRSPAANIENILYRNRGDGTFEMVEDAGGAAGPVGAAVADGAGTADSVVSADYDGDGFLDLFLTNGLNLQPEGAGGPNKLYRNVLANGNSWVQLDLVGTAGHREALGAKVLATVEGINVRQTRVKDGGYHRWAQNHTRVHFGLGTAEAVDLRITWPDGTFQDHVGVAVNRVYRATQGGEVLEPVTLGEGLAYPCGALAQIVDAAADRGVLLAKDCTTGTWQLRAARGNGEIPTFTGRAVSTSPIENIRRRGLEAGQDSLLCDGENCPEHGDNPTPDQLGVAEEIALAFEVRGGIDGFDFRPAEGANTCVTIDESADSLVFMGPFKREISNQFYLETLEPCPGGVPVPPPPPEEPPPEEPPPEEPPPEEPPPEEPPPAGNDGGDSGGGAIGLPWLVALLATLAWRRGNVARPIVS